MPRTLSNERSEMTFRDNISGTDITLYYTMPTTEERVAYANEQVVRKRDKVINQTGETRLKYGLKILTGFAEGAFAKGKDQPLSWDPVSPHFDPAWKTLVKKYASDLVSALAVTVFEVSVMPKTPEAPEEEEQEDEPEGDGDVKTPATGAKEGSGAPPLAA